MGEGDKTRLGTDFLPPLWSLAINLTLVWRGGSLEHWLPLVYQSLPTKVSGASPSPALLSWLMNNPPHLLFAGTPSLD